MAFLEIAGLSKRFGAVDVLKGIDLELDEGGFLVLVGPSGCGKSTLLNIIAGLETPSAGEIRIDGRRVNELHASQRNIAMVFQSYALYPNMTVEGNMAFGLEMRGVGKEERRRAVSEVARTLQIEHLLGRRPSQLSGGQRQRVAMGRALVRKPQVFLFDEPLSNLDAKLRVEMRTEIKLLHQRLGTTIIYVTHDQVEAMTMATRIATLKDGALQQVATPKEIYHSPANMFVADFMGSPAMNLVPAQLGLDGNRLIARLGGRDEIALPLPPARKADPSLIGKKVVLGIRPEAIAAAPSGAQATPQLTLATCRVMVVEPAGADTYVIIRLGERDVTARLSGETTIAPASLSSFAFDMSRAVLFDPETTARIP